MKSFILSKRFLVPLFILWLLHLAYLGWEMWRTYKDNLNGKGFPFSLKFKWILNLVAGSALVLSFLVAFLVAMILYSHYYVKKERPILKIFFSTYNIIVLILIASTVFAYKSFAEPKIRLKGYDLLSQIIWAKSNQEFKDKAPELEKMPAYKTPATMTLTELFQARDSLRSIKDVGAEFEFPYLRNDKRELQRIKYEINKRATVPFSVILFYFLGVLVGASFYRLHVIVPFLVGYLIIFTLWFYIEIFLERLYKKDQIGVFLGSNGAAIFFAFIAVAGFLILRKYGVFHKKTDIDQMEPIVSDKQETQ